MEDGVAMLHSSACSKFKCRLCRPGAGLAGDVAGDGEVFARIVKWTVDLNLSSRFGGERSQLNINYSHVQRQPTIIETTIRDSKIETLNEFTDPPTQIAERTVKLDNDCETKRKSVVHKISNNSQ